ncbi:tripartite tricarboxylate transporter TctB family protein [Afifella pfennigii]|uniref:tripartite tricarboxylate transporter TctB family protein n=1 Tax=Afifella pfennigii TaxID=209897 RepID=UPI00047916CE|nr:tripartite tricarboxylate transporter TctB family protein [Afifella pfennigii]
MPRYVGEIITALCILAIAGLVIWHAADLPAGGGNFPIFAAASTIVLCLYWIAMALAGRRQPERAAPVDFDFGFDNLKPIIVVVLTIFYVALMFPVGFFTMTAIYLVGISALLGVRNWLMLGATLAVVMPLIYLFFVSFLGARLPQGFAV